MSIGQILYLSMVLTGFIVFMGTVGFVSWWSRQPRAVQTQAATASRSETPIVTAQLRKAA